MRLERYITEITKVSNNYVNKILDAGFINYKSIMKKVKIKAWPIQLAALKSAFKDFNITFMINDYKWMNKFFKIDSDDVGSTEKIQGTPIQIIINKKQLKNITSGVIRKKIFKVLSHELVHRKQFSAMDPEFMKYYSLKNADITQYFARKEEIEAYARDAINELKVGESDIVDSYYYWIKSMSMVLWKRFLKKLYQYQDLYGNDVSKNNLIKQLPELKIDDEEDDNEI
jgi:hypothetical protein